LRQGNPGADFIKEGLRKSHGTREPVRLGVSFWARPVGMGGRNRASGIITYRAKLVHPEWLLRRMSTRSV
jgi:hypothetical protein